MRSNPFGAAALAAGLVMGAAQAATVTYEELPLGVDGYWNGSGGEGGFTSGGVFHPNSFTDYGGGYSGWVGFAYSQLGDTTTGGSENQYSSYAGGGAGGSQKFAVGFDQAELSFGGLISMAGAQVSVTNTTYAALSMLNGDDFAKKFGGVSGSDPDYFLLTIEGYAGESLMGAVNFYLADFRFEDPADDYVVSDWEVVDLSPLSALGDVDRVVFRLSSTDNGPFGMNTPAYFAIDDLHTVPEPGAAGWAALAALAWARRRRRAA